MASHKPTNYAPSFLRAAIEGSRPLQLTFSEIKNTNILSTSSFIYDPSDAPLKSTQQLNVDWSKFENHTFFMSAEAKVNIAFEQIINGYPFDGTKAEIESFFEKLTGYDRWIFDSFPKFRGQLMFSGTQTNEVLPSKGSYIIVKDAAGALYPELSKKTSGDSVLNPKDTSLSIETNLFIPEIINVGPQIICQKLNSDGNHGFTLYLTSSASSTEVEARFSITSGAISLTVPCSLSKGKFNHICVTLNKETSAHYLEFFIDGISKSTTKSRYAIGDLGIDASDFIIGSGSSFIVDGLQVTPTQTLSGTLNEFRVFHAARSSTLQKQFAAKTIFAQPELKLYYKFNEPPPPLATNDADQVNSIVIDSSGNSLHSVISNFFSFVDIGIQGNITGCSLRQDSAADLTNKIIYEKDESAIVLFPAYQETLDLNSELLLSASDYDRCNPNIITRLVPQHYLLDGALLDGFEEPEGQGGSPYAGSGMPGEGKLGNVQLLLSMLYIWARFFDEMKLYVDVFSTLRTVDYETNTSMPDNFLQNLIKQYGFHLPPLFNNSTIDQYVNAENIDQDFSTNATSLKFVQNELLRRVLINLPEVLRSKGTQHSIKVFLRSMGIDPDNSVRIREYGGPTTRQLSFSRETKRDVGTMVEFITSSFATSPYLSASRYEPGIPTIAGTFVKQNLFPPNGISDNSNDGLLTSGSWTVESIVKYTPHHINLMTSATQSLVRMCVTGSLPDGLGLVANLLVVSSSVSPKLLLYIRPGNNEDSPTLQMSMSIPLGAIFDSDKWNVSFGCERNDLIGSIVSSSYFLRLGNQNNGDIDYIKTTSSFFYELITSESNSLRTKSILNASGAFITIGENTTIPEGGGNTYLYLNNSTDVNLEARVTAFTGLQSNLRFWSKALTVNEWTEHVRNYKSVGVNDPLVNYNYVKTRDGSFEKLRLDSLTKQTDRRAVEQVVGPSRITFLDFSVNGMHITGSGFPTDSDCVKSELFDSSYLSPYFDEASTNEKIRIRSYQNQELIDATPWAQTAPVYELVKSEQPTDDVRFSVEFSLIDVLNRDIVTLFSTFEALDNALGAPELIFSPDYPDLEKLRDVYFNRISEKLNFKAFFDFFRWFDSSIGTFIQQLIPRKTNFKGTNFVIESHMLERHKLEYLHSEIYLSEANRNRIKDVLLLQLIAGSVRKY